MKYCPSCGAAAQQVAAFCMSCEKAFPQPNSESPLDYHKNGARIKKRKFKRYSPQQPHEPDSVPSFSEGEQVEEHTREEAPYDGYYDDVIPLDDGAVPNQFDKAMMKQVAIIIGVAVLIITLTVALMQFL